MEPLPWPIAATIKSQDCFGPDQLKAEQAGELARLFRLSYVPKGVYRFASHEEADAWLIEKRIEHRRRLDRADEESTALQVCGKP